MRGTALSTLRSMLKAEIGDYSGSNANRDAELNLLLSNKQIWLASEYAWPFLERRWEVAIAPNQQYAAFPTVTAGDPETETVAINLDQAPLVECYYNQVYSEVIYGIGRDEYNSMDKAQGQTSDPIQRWRLATNPDEVSNPNQFEVWPVPVTPQKVRFTGQRQLNQLTADSDMADLDDLLLVLFVASERLARTKQADAQQKMALAQRRLQMLRQNYPVRSVTRTMDGCGDAQWRKTHHLTGMIIVK